MRVVRGTRNHATLVGLTSGDPHTQYPSLSGGDRFTGDLDLANNIAIRGRNAADTSDRDMLSMTTGNQVQLGVTDRALRLQHNGSLLEIDGAASFALQSLRHQEHLMKGADETVNNSVTLQDDDVLLWTVGAGEDWLFMIQLELFAQVASDFKYAFAVPADSSGRRGEIYNNIQQNIVGMANSQVLTVPDTNIRPVFIHGVYEGGSNAGVVQLQWAQNTAVVEDTIVGEHSFLFAYRIR